jgi:hypothetical protein
MGIESVLGPMYPLVGHAYIPFQVGGPVDMYYFSEAVEGTGIATMELIEPDGSGPKPSTIGTYELVAFTKLRIGETETKEQFEKMDLRMRKIFTVIGRYSFEEQLNPKETIEVPANQGEENKCVILDEFRNPKNSFMIGNKKHGLMLVIEIFRSEMEFAMKNGSASLFSKLTEKGYYPYSDLDRDPVI